MRASAALSALCALLLWGCATVSTEVVSSWKDPGFSQWNFNKIIAVAIMNDGATRRHAEDAMVEQLRRQGMDAVAAYTILGMESTTDMAEVKRIIQKSGSDGAVTLRIVENKEIVSYVPGGAWPSYYNTFYGYYGYTWGLVYDPGYVITDQLVVMETNIYSVSENKLIWSGTTETFNPDDAEDLMDEVARSVAMELTRQGVKKKYPSGE